MVNVAVIGTGAMGRHHVRIYSELEDVNLVAISDLDEINGKKLAEKHSCNFYTDFKEMLDKEDIDAVSIVVPTKFHTSVALYCTNRGKHILLEKPISDNIADAKAIIDTCNKNKVKLLVGHIERFNPAIDELKKQVDLGTLGDITSIISKRVGLFPSRIKDADVVVDLAVHDIDVFNYLLGSTPEKVNSNLGNVLIDDRPDYANILLKYNGASAFIEVNWTTPVKIRTLSITGTKGYAELNYITQELVLYETNAEKEFDSFGDFVIKFGEAEHKNIEIKKSEPLKNELMHFIDCIETDTKPIITGEDALSALKVCLEVTGDKN
ncbi:MAG: gfo/Idh/MocA family oxidoreductase [Nanohaloarchaea archaeon]|nr:gfo/Idh/MocA family oxidoreductase [Candidatus Nanohaloarchaea archaeon]